MILLQIAERAIFNLKEMETDDLKLHIPKLIEEANLYWTRQEQTTAKHLMKSLMNKLDKVDIDTLYLSTEKNYLIFLPTNMLSGGTDNSRLLFFHEVCFSLASHNRSIIIGSHINLLKSYK